MSAAIGERVGAVMSATKTHVKLFGFGTYIGDRVPEPGVTMMGIDMHELGIPNPRIELDNGDLVVGCE